jgi:hypothetical protein
VKTSKPPAFSQAVLEQSLAFLFGVRVWAGNGAAWPFQIAEGKAYLDAGFARVAHHRPKGTVDDISHCPEAKAAFDLKASS